MSKLFRNLKLRTKLIASVLTVSLVVLITISVFTHIWYQAELKNESIERLRMTSRNYAADVSKLFEDPVSTASTLSNTFGQMAAGQTADRKLAEDIVKEEIRRQARYESLWLLWEPNAFDGKDSEFITEEQRFGNETGRFAVSFYRMQGQIKYRTITETTASGSIAQSFKEMRKLTVGDPMLRTYEEGKPGVTVLSVRNPIISGGAYLGTAGIDMSVEVFEKMISEMKPYTGSSVQIINNRGMVVFRSDTTLESRPFAVEGNNSLTESITANVRAGKEMIAQAPVNGKNYYYALGPVKITGADAWSLCIAVPESSLMASVSKIIRTSSFLFFPGILLLLICVILSVNGIVRPINGANKVLNRLSLGHVSKAEQLPVKNNDEIGKMSQALNALTTGLREMLEFAEKIGKRDYSVEYHLLSDGDELGAEMLEMRNNLAESAEKEKRFKEEEECRNWVNHGLAEFAEVLRNNSNNMETLSYQMISRMVKYLDANQGGFFVVNDDDPSHPFLELTASYAYERRKYMEKKIEAGEGLVGTCYREGETIFMNDIPDGYVQITSGIGKANPRCLVIVPLKVNDIIYGIMEIASFKKIEPYQIDFLEKMGATTASTISAVKTNQHTAKLLEQSQMQSQRLSEQEEEMRQNMEEMQATQEEMYRKNLESEHAQQELSDTLAKMQSIQDTLEDEKFEIQSVMNAVDDVFMRITYDADMTLLDINDSCLELHGATREQMIGIKLTDKMNPKDIPAFRKNWDKVLAGETFKGEGIRKTRNGDKHVWYMYSPIKDASGKVHKVLMLGRFLDDM